MLNIANVVRGRGAEIRYGTSGSTGPDILVIHGAGMDHSMFVPQAETLSAAGFRVTAWDLRGHGSSTLDPGVRFSAADALDDIDRVVEKAGLHRPVLIGHSLGGNLAQAFVRRHPHRVGGLIVLDATWNTGPLTAGERMALRLAAPLLKMVPARSLPRVMARASAVTDGAIATAEALFGRMSKRRFIDVWRATVSLVQPDPAYRTPVPLALVRGADDRTGNIARAMPAWAAAEGIREHVIADAGHIVTLDAPEEVSRIILDTLEQWRRDLTDSDAWSGR